MSEASFIGVVSDTHGYYDPALDDLFAGATGIVHAGRSVLPRTAVSGARTRSRCRMSRPPMSPAWGDWLPWEAEAVILGLRVLVCHIGSSLMGRHDPVAEGFDLVISGHSHKAAVEWRGEALFLNPGSAGRARFGQPRTAALVAVKDGQPEPRIMSLD